MFDMGFLELALIAGVGLIVLGPERLPVAARTVGRYVGQMRRFVGNFQRQIEQEVRLEELNKKIMSETEGQTFTNNDGSEKHGAGSDPGAVEKPPQARPGPGVKNKATATSAAVDKPAANSPESAPAPADTGPLDGPADAPTRADAKADPTDKRNE